MNKLNYVTQTNDLTREETIIGFNLNKVEANELFYSLGIKQNSAMGHKSSGDAHLHNVIGCHVKKFKNEEEATLELIEKPNAFNDALWFVEKYGFDVVKKGVVHKNQVVHSYQSAMIIEKYGFDVVKKGVVHKNQVVQSYQSAMTKIF